MPRGGRPMSNGYGCLVRLTLPKAGAFGENTISKNWVRSQILVQKLGGIVGKNVTFDLSVSALKAGICNKKNRRKWQN